MKKIKTAIVISSIVGIILFGITLFEFGLLQLLGMEYESFTTLVIFLAFI